MYSFSNIHLYIHNVQVLLYKNNGKCMTDNWKTGFENVTVSGRVFICLSLYWGLAQSASLRRSCRLPPVVGCIRFKTPVEETCSFFRELHLWLTLVHQHVHLFQTALFRYEWRLKPQWQTLHLGKNCCDTFTRNKRMCENMCGFLNVCQISCTVSPNYI